MTDFNEIMKQAQQMQERFKQAQTDLAKLEVEGVSGAGLVKVKMNGRHDVKQVHLDSELLTEDKSVVEDLIAAAMNDATRKLEEKNRDAMGSMMGGLNLPEGFKFPF
ncbi:MAG: YbaB/EbfC family nucleoid-associated protein [Gammaproteobacteria bacterium]